MKLLPELSAHDLAKRTSYFFSKVPVRKEGECWPWEPLPKRRPQMYWARIDGKNIVITATTFAYWLGHGVWPTYLEHTCDYWPCHNWSHLLDSDHKSNMRSMSERNRTANGNKEECPAGHSYAKYGAIRHRGNGTEFRVCKRCILEDTWRRRGGPSAASEGRDLNPMCPKCGGPWAVSSSGSRSCRPCRAAYLREWRSRSAASI
jgi:hypothetical protein